MYAHNWQDFRRKPHLFDYDPRDACNNWQTGTFIGCYQEGCPLEAFCARSHGWKEQIYHPLLYKIHPCQQRKCTLGLQCGNYHPREGDQRFPQDFSAVFSPLTHRANPPHALTPEERSTQQAEVVLDNPNHVVEFLANTGLSNCSEAQLSAVLS